MLIVTLVFFMLLALAAASAEHLRPTLRWKKPVDEKVSLHSTDVDLQGAGGGGTSSGDSDSGDKKGCFAGSETLLLESGAFIPIDQVKIGDRVQVASIDGLLSFADVVFLPHEKNTQLASFIEIETESGASLKATPTHFVMAGTCGDKNMRLSRVEDVAVGYCVLTTLGEVAVIRVSKTQERGVYTLITSHKDGIVVVNGFIASSFSYNHMIANFYYRIHRELYEHIGRDFFAFINMKSVGLFLENMVATVTF